MNAPEHVPLPDVQSAVDARNLSIHRVGVKSLRYPLQIAAAGGPVSTVAMVDMYVALPAERKGTHMSRFLQVLQQFGRPLARESMRALLADMLRQLDAQEGSIRVQCPYFINKAAPVSGVQSLMDYELVFEASQERGRVRVRQKVVVPVTSLCPCSKEISEYGAHNQRSHVSIDLELGADMSIEEQVRIAEDAASCELWSVLKRADEKYVTERAYDNPKFVEDTVRDVAIVLRRDPRVLSFRVESENFEAIHNHSAYALIEGERQPG